MGESENGASRAYRAVLRLLRLLVRLFFRRVEITGQDAIPEDRGGIVVSWHPNGLVDPGLILTSFPRPIVFGARHGLFRWPLLGALLRAIGTVPIFRVVDAEQGKDPGSRREGNARSLDALASRVGGGAFSALFPEGVSHDDPYVRELKTGVARLYYDARRRAPAGATPPAILPVGLHYDEKRIFRSSALVWYHPPLILPPELDVTPPEDEPEEAAKARAKALTSHLERVLDEVCGSTEDWETHHLLHRVRKIVRAERSRRVDAELARPGPGEKALAFQRIRTGYYARLASDPAQVEALRARVRRYDEDLDALGLQDHELDRDPRLASRWLAILLSLHALFVFLLLPPVLVFGYLANLPTALALLLLCRLAARQRKDEATIKLLVGALAFPLTWIVAGVLGSFGHEALHEAFPGLPDRPLLAGLSVGLAAALGGAAGMRYLHRAQETARAIRIRLTRRRRQSAIAWLLKERAELHDGVIALAGDLELPGQVSEDGRIVAARAP